MHYLGRSVLSFMVRIKMLVWSSVVWMKTAVGYRNAMCFKSVTLPMSLQAFKCALFFEGVYESVCAGMELVK